MSNLKQAQGRTGAINCTGTSSRRLLILAATYHNVDKMHFGLFGVVST